MHITTTINFWAVVVDYVILAFNFLEIVFSILLHNEKPCTKTVKYSVYIYFTCSWRFLQEIHITENSDQVMKQYDNM